SGVQSSNPGASPLVLSIEGVAVNGSVVVTDRAGNTATFASPTVKIDKTPPSLTASRTPAANGYGWNNSDVTVTFSCADALSGATIVTPGTSMVLSSEGSNQTAAGTCMDLAGNTAVLNFGP